MKNIKGGISKVAIVKCYSYNQKEVDNAVKKSLELAEIKIPFRKTVLIKPNIVGSFPKKQKIATTNPTVIEAICKILKNRKCKIIIGESSFMNTINAFKDSGIEKIAKKYGAVLIFEQDKLIKIKDSKAKILKEFRISKTLKNADLIINIPKLKTHLLTKISGAIKNIYGVIPGGMKQKLHAFASNEKKFSSLLVDIYQNILPEITIMDGIEAMEGKGPTAGNLKKANRIIVSRDGIAVDIVAARIMGYKIKNIYMIKESLKRKISSGKFLLVGEKEIPSLGFDKPHVRNKLSKNILRLLKVKPIVVNKEKCIKCGICAKHCPMSVIKLSPYPIVDKKKCIRCFCCMEICPNHALYLKE